ncbi:hypothetical protein CVT25_014749 [Psilocybe cyanescens]|uniref:Uncharacterized protein n=1 Tax=Psilocybe cyanescens TaxID=93625 RepID=A0A409X5A3_PSICY|nr:hypothetical protein CVT25_014749 [Psilocybe cyanescens]
MTGAGAGAGAGGGQRAGRLGARHEPEREHVREHEQQRRYEHDLLIFSAYQLSHRAHRIHHTDLDHPTVDSNVLQPRLRNAPTLLVHSASDGVNDTGAGCDRVLRNTSYRHSEYRGDRIVVGTR